MPSRRAEDCGKAPYMLLFFGSLLALALMFIMHQQGVAILYGVVRKSEEPAFFNLALLTDIAIIMMFVLVFERRLESPSEELRTIGDLILRVFVLTYGVFSAIYSKEAMSTGVVRSQYGRIERDSPWFMLNWVCYAGMGVGITLYGCYAVVSFLAGARYF
jgi:hypothetical protein